MRTRIVFSVSEDYFAAARTELLGVFGGAHVERLGPDTGCLSAPGIDIGDVADACRHRPLVFVRHLMREVARVPPTAGDAAIDRIREAALEIAQDRHIDDDLALQVWTSGTSPITSRSDALWQQLAHDLSQVGVTVTRANRRNVLSVCLTPTGIVLGMNRSADSLCDWPGGRVRLARDDSQISRAEFKLEELVKVFDLALPAGGVAADLGASPGGWTRVLRRSGLRVWAIDPAALDPRIASDPGVRHVRTTAGQFLAEADRGTKFDVLVNDMRMVADLSCRLMLDASSRLKPGGLAVVMLKISPHEPLTTVARSLRSLDRSYEILHARQLYHNRNEVTVVARRREQAAGRAAHRPRVTGRRSRVDRRSEPPIVRLAP